MSYWLNTNINKWLTQLFTGALLCKGIVHITIMLQKYSRLPISRGWVGYSDTQHNKYIHAYINKILFHITDKYSYQH
jgi:hypothetical protein